MAKKHIKIVEGRDSDKVYKSYKAVARDLKEGEEVTVCVREACGDIMVLAGYGKVKNEGTYYSCPILLNLDW